MTARKRSVLEWAGRIPTEPTDRYECPYCEATFVDLPDACPDCDRVVVRVVEPRPVPDH